MCRNLNFRLFLSLVIALVVSSSMVAPAIGQDKDKVAKKEADAKTSEDSETDEVDTSEFENASVVVKEWGAEFKLPEGTVGEAEVGNIYQVAKTNGKWLWITNAGGWIDSTKVVKQKDAEAYFTSVVKKKADANSYFDRGLAYMRSGNLDKAMLDFDEAIGNGKNAAFFNGRGIAWLKKGDPKKAIADHDRALKINPKLSSGYYNRGNAHKAQQKYDKAIADYNLALQLSPKNGRALVNRGLCYHKKRDYKRAVEDFTAAIKINDRWPLPYNNRADAYNRMHEYDKAIEDADTALKLNPTFTWAFTNRGNSWKAKKDYAKALRDYDQALGIDPRFAPAYHNRANTMTVQGEYPRALKDYAQAIQFDPEYASAYNGWAWILATCPQETLRDPKQALALAQKACTLDNQEWSHYGTLAAAWADQGDFKKAVKSQKKAIDMLPDTASKADREGCEERLKMFEDEKPWRDKYIN